MRRTESQVRDNRHCKNCGGTGWTCYSVPGTTLPDGTILMRERITPCHVCNAQDWKQWAQQVVSHGERTRESK